MKPLVKFTLKLGIYGTMLLYVAGDLFWFDGPLRRQIDRHAKPHLTPPDASGIVAQVLTQSITRSQLSRAIRERLWLEGKSPGTLQPSQRQWLTYAVLGDLIHHELLRVKAKAHAENLRVTPAEVEARFKEFSARFGDENQLRLSIAAQGIGSLDDLRARLAAEIQQERYLDSRISPLIQVTDEEITSWHRGHPQDFIQPERLLARHVFLSTLERSTDEARQQLSLALAELQAGNTRFETLAATLSEDEANRANGGSLGWMSRTRLPDDFAQAVFDLPVNSPAIVTSRIGIHLIEVLARQPSSPRSLDDCREEIRAAITAIKREQAVPRFLDALRRMESDKIRIFHESLADLPQ